MAEEKRIIGFKFFNSEEEFVKWQLEKPRKVWQISPFLVSLGGTIEDRKEDTETGKFDMQGKVKIFVTYEYDISS